MEQVESPPAHALIELSRYVAPQGRGVRTYLRFNPADPDDPVVRYERRSGGGMVAEGSLAKKPVRTVTQYLARTPGGQYLRGMLWPQDPQKQGAAFFLEFDPPLARLPRLIDANGGFNQECRLRYFNRDAVEARGGSVTRQVVFEGFETIEAGGLEYAGCVRLRIETRYRIRWAPRVNVSEYVWLAPGIGEVRRVESFSGLALPVFFNGLHVYELIGESPESSAATQLVRASAIGPSPVEAWSSCAVYLDRLLPRPRLGGLAVELASPQQGGTLAGAIAPSRRDRVAHLLRRWGSR